MTTPRTFAIITPDILEARISDLAFRIYAIIYSLNYAGVREIPDKELSSFINKSVVTINRAVNELKRADLIDITMMKSHRFLTVRKTFEKAVVECAQAENRYNKVPDALQSFFKLWDHEK